jgi:hypothetical protein
MFSARSVWDGGDGLSRFYKLGVVLVGYAAALLASYAVCYVLQRLHPGPDPSGGMQAFGDMLLFLGIFGFLALFPTALALHFLRPVEKFWTVFSIASLALAATGPVALLVGKPYLSPWLLLFVGIFGLWEVLGAPLLCLGFVFCALIAPARRPRRLLIAASGIEFAVGAYAFYCLFILGHWVL